MTLHFPPPRFITPGTPGSDSEGRAIAKLARVLGKPLMPWQRLVVERATEKTEQGFYRYPTVLITVPRQSGKTTLVGPVQLHRIMTRPGIKAFFTAQTGKDARARFNDLTELVTASSLAPLFKIRRAAGTEAISCANRSSINVFAPTPGSIHGETPHLVTLDEIWKHDQVRGSELMGAIGPAQSTLEGDSQVWMISTMGTAQSGFMNEWVERGRAGHPGLFYAEWSMPDGHDPYRPATWWVFHPALGNTINQGVLEKEAKDQPPGEWMRAYMNRLTQSSDPLVLPDVWAKLNVKPKEIPSRRKLAISYEVAPNNEAAAVMASWRDTDGAPCSRVLHRAPGTAWLIPFIVTLVREWKPAVLAADDGGETRRITDELERLGMKIYKTGPRDFATACVSLLSYARDKSLRHGGEISLAAAIAIAVLRPMGDSFRFSRKDSPGDIAPLIAAAIGIWAYDHQEPSLGKPTTKF